MKAGFTMTSNAREFAANLDAYCRVSSKGYGVALESQAWNFCQDGDGGLYSEFRKIRPPEGSIFAAAKGRNFRVARTNSTSLVPTSGGVSMRAMAKAQSLLHGQKSELFNRDNLKVVKFGARGVNKHRIIRRGGKSSLRGYQLTADQLSAALNEPYANGGKKGDNVRRLNLRALAVLIELLYRRNATHGGTMAIQWLHKEWKRNQWGQKIGGVLEARSKAQGHQIIGTVEFEKTATGELQGVIINGFVPGTGEQAQKHNIIDKVFAVRSASLLKAIENAHKKAAREKGLSK